MGKCKAQNMKMTCFPADLWLWGECFNREVSTKTRIGTTSRDFQTKVLYIEPTSIVFSYDASLNVHCLPGFAIGTKKGLSLHVLHSSPHLFLLRFDYCKFTVPFIQYFQALRQFNYGLTLNLR